MGLRAYTSTVLLGGALVAGLLGCSSAGGGGAAGGGGLGGTSETSGIGGTSVGGAGGASGWGGSGGGTAGGAGIDGVSGSGGQPPSGDDGGADSGPADAGPDGPACTPGLPCQPVNSCRTGTTSCTTGTALCVATGDQPNGTACGLFLECLNGSCNTDRCEPKACTPSNPCHTGTISCLTGTSVCQDTGTPIPDGTRCGTAKACLSGTCVACAASDAACSSP